MIPSAKRAIRALIQHDVPFAFVSNACTLESDKADQLSKMLETPVKYNLTKTHFNQVILIHLDSSWSSNFSSHTNALFVWIPWQTCFNLWTRTYRRNCSNVNIRKKYDLFVKFIIYLGLDLRIQQRLKKYVKRFQNWIWSIIIIELNW